MQYRSQTIWRITHENGKLAATIRKELARDVDYWICSFMSSATAPDTEQNQWRAGRG